LKLGTYLSCKAQHIATDRFIWLNTVKRTFFIDDPIIKKIIYYIIV